MNKTIWTIDLRSLITGFCLALAVALLFSNFWHSRADNGKSISADESGVYVLDGEVIRYIDKQKCNKRGGCFSNGM